MALFDRIFEYLDLDHEIEDAPDAVDLPVDAVRGSVTLRDVWFRYEGPPDEGRVTPISPSDLPAAGAGREWTLEDVSLEIEPGQLAALVGPSGAGKTTITYLVPRLYDVQRGAVLIDGHDVREGRPRVARRRDRGRDAGDLPVPHDDPAEPPLRQARRDAGGAGGRGPGGEHPRADRGASRGLRHRRRRARLQALGRREAAPRDRAGDPQGPADPDPRRGDLVAGHDVGAARAGGARAADARADDDRDRAPPVDDPAGRRDLRRGPWPRSSSGDARRAARSAEASTRACTSSSSAADWSRPVAEDGVILASGEVVRTASEPTA